MIPHRAELAKIDWHVVAVLFESSALLMVLTLAILAVTTFLALWKIVGVSPSRAVVYVIAVIVFHSLMGAAILAIGMPEQTMYGDWEWPQ